MAGGRRPIRELPMEAQTDLLDWVPPQPRGETFQPDRDGPRLRGQALRVFALMRDGEWRTLDEISDITGDPEASISARLRGLRKHYTVDREYVENGLHRYRVVC